MLFVSINLPFFLIIGSTSSSIFMGDDYHLQPRTEIEKKSDYSTREYWL
jgi:hypothetical protein